ncbi:MAG: hypothetical protein ACD_79C01302G0014 [uncultured bacterium]|nr:MAG: hypothetical protein ACD_79C01302G0014 [uncultured bacterium]
MISIIDYQMSNLQSLENAIIALGNKTIITSDCNVILKSDAVILPGVGAFGKAIDNLKKLDLINPINDFIQSGKPFLGVCLGMQLLFSESEEYGYYKGLNIIRGKVKKIPQRFRENILKVPHVGWNSIFNEQNEKWFHSPLKDIKQNEYVYFVHSYYVNPENEEYVLSFTDYNGFLFCSGIQKNNVYGFQFHPEKSGVQGVNILRNFINLIPEK